MSGKFSNQKNTREASAPARKQRRIRRFLLAAVGVALIALVFLISFLLSIREGTPAEIPLDTTAQSQEKGTQPTNQASLEQVESAAINLGHSLKIVDIGSYTGIYMEDGTDEIVSGVLMIVVSNTGEDAIQYAEITLDCPGDSDAFFTLSTLPAGASVVLLEKTRMPYDDGADYGIAVIDNIALFPEELSLHQDSLKIQGLDGAINVTNISGEDITGEIVIYYKNSSVDMFYGGITYRARIQNGLGAGQTHQIMTKHYSDSGSSILFVTIG